MCCANRSRVIACRKGVGAKKERKKERTTERRVFASSLSHIFRKIYSRDSDCCGIELVDFLLRGNCLIGSDLDGGSDVVVKVPKVDGEVLLRTSLRDALAPHPTHFSDVQ